MADIHYSTWQFVLHTAHNGRYHSIAPFLLSVSQTFPRHCPPAGWSADANADCTEVDVLVFGTKTVSLNQWYSLITKTTAFTA
jgi:hypothetical protein